MSIFEQTVFEKYAPRGAEEYYYCSILNLLERISALNMIDGIYECIANGYTMRPEVKAVYINKYRGDYNHICYLHDYRVGKKKDAERDLIKIMIQLNIPFSESEISRFMVLANSNNDETPFRKETRAKVTNLLRNLQKIRRGESVRFRYRLATIGDLLDLFENGKTIRDLKI